MSQMIGNPKTGLTQMMSTPNGGLMVYPHYETSKQTPDYILVSVIYDQPIAKIFTEERVSELLGQATAELGGKYIVDNFAKSEGYAIVIHLVIRQANTPMD